MTINIQLLIIDPQQDFCNPNGSLFIPGSTEDIDRLSVMIKRLKNKISNIHVTLDSHHPVDIAHSIWFRDTNGNHPTPFTHITASDMKNRIWGTTQPDAYKRTLAYLEALEIGKRYPHVIWPNHCLIGTEGNAIMPQLNEAFLEWTNRFNWVNYITKGSNPWTEHFSALKAEVPDQQDMSTQINANLIEALEGADVVLLAGEASSHCLANTVMDIADNFASPKFIEKIHLLKDTTSPVPGFAHLETIFIDNLVKKGMKVTTSDFFN